MDNDSFLLIPGDAESQDQSEPILGQSSPHQPAQDLALPSTEGGWVLIDDLSDGYDDEFRDPHSESLRGRRRYHIIGDDDADDEGDDGHRNKRRKVQ